MHKRGQVTVFIILGIVIIALIGMLFFFRGDLIESIFEGETSGLFTSADIEPVKDVVQGCVEITLMDAIEHVSNQGGYNSPVLSDSYSRDSYGVPVVYAWTCNAGTRLPSLDALGTQLNLYMSDHRDEIIECIDSGIEVYKKSWTIQNINEFNLGDASISETYVRQRIYYDGANVLSVKKGDYAATATEVLAELNIALGQAQEMAAEIAGCYNGDFVGVDEAYNSYCNVDGIPFRTELYNMRNYRNVITLLQTTCAPDQDECYHLLIPAPNREDILFNVALKTC
jgi:hypothetical protein